MGTVTSSALQFVLAAIPGKPTPAPQVDSTNTNVSQIKVTFVNSNADDGGSGIRLLQLEMDDGLLGEFKTVLSTVDRQYFIAKEGIVRGR
jgi:hypothetical protein